MFARITALALNIRESREGAVAIYMAGMLVVLLGMAGLGTEIGLVLYKRQQQQMAADTAAYGGAVALAKGESLAAITLEARAITANSGYVHGQSGVVVTVNTPPLIIVPQAGNTNAVEVIIEQPQTLLIANLVTTRYGSGPINWTVKAGAAATAGGGGSCVAQLLPNQNPGVTIGNGATVALKGCGMRVCSTRDKALSMSGGAQLNITDPTSGNSSNSYPVSVSGLASINNGAAINGNGNTCSTPCSQSAGLCSANVDPYASKGETMPASPGGCGLGIGKSYPWHSGNPAYTFSQGVWCDSVTFGQGLTYKFMPGVYYVNRGTFNVTGGATLTGTGVTIVLTGSGGNYANVDIGGGTNVTLSAPTSGATSGIAFFGDPNAPVSNTNKFQGGANINITGAYYFPSQTVIIDNGVVSNSAVCTQLIAGVIQFQGGMQFSTNCNNAGTAAIGGSATKLVE